MFRRLIPALTAGSLVIGVLAFAESPASAAMLAAPAGLSTSAAGGDLALAWQRLDGASAYHLQIATEITTPTLVKDVTTYAPAYVVPDAIDASEGRELYWRVAAFGTATTASTQGAFTDWQPLNRDALAAPVTVSPGSETLSAPSTIGYPASVTFRWKPVPGAAQYVVQYSSMDDFSSDVTTAPGTTASSYTPPAALARSEAAGDVVWHWRVRADFTRAVSGATTTVSGPYSSARAFTLIWAAKPELIRPVGSASKFSDLRFTWSPVIGARGYRIQLASGRSVSLDTLTTILDEAIVQGTTWVPTKTLTPTNYYWRVTPIDASGLDGTPSVIAQFTKFWGAQTDESAPSTATSAYPIVDQGTTERAAPEEIPFEDFELSWRPLARATLYAVTVKSVDDGDPLTNEVVLTCRTASTSVTVVQKVNSGRHLPGAIDSAANCLWSSKTSTIQIGRTYRWSVTAVDYAGASETPITTATPTGSLESLPSDPEGGSTADLLRARYIKVVSGSAQPTPTVDLDETAWAQQTTLGLKGQPAPLFDWAPMSGAGGYEVQVAVNAEFDNNEVVTFYTKSTRLRATGVFDDDSTDQPYYWRVRAFVDLDASPLMYLGNWSAESLSWIKQSTPIDFAGVSPVTILEDGTTLLAWRPQSLSGPKDGGSRGYRIFIRNSANSLVGLEDVEYPFYAARKPGTTVPLAAGDYTFSVVALDASVAATDPDNWDGVPSEPRSFTIAAPAPTAPASDVASSSVSLRWTPVAVASSYSLTYGLVGSATTTTLSPTQTRVTIADLAPGTYSWTVRSKDASGNPSTETPPQTFVIAAATPVLTTGAGVTLDAAMGRLDWNAVPGASRYVVRIADNVGMTTPTAIETSATSYVPTTALSYGKPYYWNVSAVPEKVTTSPARVVLGTASAQAFTVVTAPAGPLTVQTPTVTVTNATVKVTVTWTAPTAAQKGSKTDSDAPIPLAPVNPLQYDVRYRATGVDGVENEWFETTVPDSLSYATTGLPVNTACEIQVRVRTTFGAGPWSTVKTFKTPGAPSAVSNVVTSAASGGLKVSWTAAPSNGSAVTGHVVTYRLAGSVSWVPVTATTATSVVVKGLTGGSNYAVSVAAKNSVGTGPAAITSAIGVSAPGAPTSVKATRGSGTVKVSWVAPTNAGGPGQEITGYFVQTRQYYAGAWTLWSSATSTTSSVRTATVTGLAGGRKYQVQVLAKNVLVPSGGAPSAVVSFTGAIKPSTPTSVKATVYTGKIKISWVKPALNGSTLSGYTVYRSYDRTTWTKITATPVSASALYYMWTGETKGKKYYFGVVANSNVGSSSRGTSTIVTAK